MLTTAEARRIFHEGAEAEPIIDYHCHLQPSEMVANEKWENVTRIWLDGDHYKWRLLRAVGYPENLVTDKSADPWERFLAFATTLEKCAGNPLFEWTQLELARFFNITEVLNSESARRIYDECNRQMAADDFRPRDLVARSNVKVVCTTDDPIDDLENHKTLASIEDRFQVLPSFRPDRAYQLSKPTFPEYAADLAKTSGVKFDTFKTHVKAIEERLKFFKSVGCKVSDHAFVGLPFVEELPTEKELNAILSKALKGKAITPKEEEAYQFAFIIELMGLYKKYDVVMQWHMGCARDLNTDAFGKTGPDTGYDSIADTVGVEKGMEKILDTANLQNKLPICIWYSLNPNDWMVILTVMGGFQNHQNGKQQMHFGSGWWFDDTFAGMTDQITKLAELSPLGNFLGMLTDSRSFLSYPRHEYFRRVLSEHLGNLVHSDRLPLDMAVKTAKAISYNNAKHLFDF